MVAIDILRGRGDPLGRAVPPLGRPGVLPGRAARVLRAAHVAGEAGQRAVGDLHVVHRPLLPRRLPGRAAVHDDQRHLAHHRRLSRRRRPALAAILLRALPQAAAAVLGRRRDHLRRDRARSPGGRRRSATARSATTSATASRSRCTPSSSSTAASSGRASRWCRACSRIEWFFAPQLALWFVGLLAQYYLLFPLLFWLMRRIGVVRVPRADLRRSPSLANWWIVHEYGALELKFFLVTGWAPFRLFEFTAGMAIGWLLIAPRGVGAGWRVARRPEVIVAALVLGLRRAHRRRSADRAMDRGQLTSRGAGIYLQSLALPLVTLGLALLALPLLVQAAVARRRERCRCARSRRSASCRTRCSSSTTRCGSSRASSALEDVPGAVWWTFLVAVYVPVSIAARVAARARSSG